MKAKPGEYNYATTGSAATARDAEKFDVATRVKAVTYRSRARHRCSPRRWPGGSSPLGCRPCRRGSGQGRQGEGARGEHAEADRRAAACQPIAKAAFPNAESTRVAMLAPAKTPRDIVAKLNAEVNRALQSPEVKDRLAKLGTEPMAMTPDSSTSSSPTSTAELGDIMGRPASTPGVRGEARSEGRRR